ncbi:hypothetical protein [Nannocystis pusilla]|uniref:hypothetical protein n=1 Tax=Nannocystis pusilla TaxID=889268 RepID=UPI003B7D8D23
MLIVGSKIRPAANTSVASDEAGGILSALHEVVEVRVAPFIAPRSPAEQRQRDDETPLATATRLIGGSLALLNIPVELLGTGFALLTAPLGAAVPRCLPPPSLRSTSALRTCTRIRPPCRSRCRASARSCSAAAPPS